MAVGSWSLLLTLVGRYSSVPRWQSLRLFEVEVFLGPVTVSFRLCTMDQHLSDGISRIPLSLPLHLLYLPPDQSAFICLFICLVLAAVPGRILPPPLNVFYFLFFAVCRRFWVPRRLPSPAVLSLPPCRCVSQTISWICSFVVPPSPASSTRGYPHPFCSSIHLSFGRLHQVYCLRHCLFHRRTSNR